MNGIHLSFPTTGVNLYLIWENGGYIMTVGGKQYKLSNKDCAAVVNNLLVRKPIGSKKLKNIMLEHRIYQC